MRSLRLLEIIKDPQPDSVYAFAERVHGPQLPGFGCPAEELAQIRMPTELRRFYEFAGRWPGLYSQNRLLPAAELRVLGDRLIFFVENQGVYTWSTMLEGENPPVWYSTAPRHGRWEAERAPLSIFLLQTLLIEYSFGVGAKAQAVTEYHGVSAAEAARVLRPFRSTAYSPFGFPPPATWLMATDDAVAQFTNGGMPRENEFRLWIGAASGDALATMLPLGDAWSYGWAVDPNDRPESLPVDLVRGEDIVASLHMLLASDGTMRRWQSGERVRVLVGDVLDIGSGIRIPIGLNGYLAAIDVPNPLAQQGCYALIDAETE